MLDLAIAIGADGDGTSLIETNNGEKLRAPRWPQDCEFQLVAFGPEAKTCSVVWTEELVDDIRHALSALDQTKSLKGKKPDWYSRLSLYSKAVASSRTQGLQGIAANSFDSGAAFGTACRRTSERLSQRQHGRRRGMIADEGLHL